MKRVQRLMQRPAGDSGAEELSWLHHIAVLDVDRIPKTSSEKQIKKPPNNNKQTSHERKTRKKKKDLHSAFTEYPTYPICAINYSNNLLTIDIIISSYS